MRGQAGVVLAREVLQGAEQRAEVQDVAAGPEVARQVRGLAHLHAAEGMH